MRLKELETAVESLTDGEFIPVVDEAPTEIGVDLGYIQYPDAQRFLITLLDSAEMRARPVRCRCRWGTAVAGTDWRVHARWPAQVDGTCPVHARRAAEREAFGWPRAALRKYFR